MACTLSPLYMNHWYHWCAADYCEKIFLRGPYRTLASPLNISINYSQCSIHGRMWKMPLPSVNIVWNISSTIPQLQFVQVKIFFAVLFFFNCLTDKKIERIDFPYRQECIFHTNTREIEYFAMYINLIKKRFNCMVYIISIR